MRSIPLSSLCLAGILAAGPAIATDSQSTAASPAAARAGTCEQARQQRKYWCEERAKVTVIQTGLECENAKRNVVEACDGKKSKDNVYK